MKCEHEFLNNFLSLTLAPGLRSGPMQPVRIPKLADNIALVRNVCLFRAQSPRASAGRRGRNASVVAHVWADERSGSLGTLCGRPPACYQARAFEYCAMRAHGTAMLARATSFDAVAVGGAYPPAGAVRVRRLAVGRITSNVGHDLFLEGLSDLFAQQQLGGGPGAFDAVLLEAFWFHSARSFLAAPASKYLLQRKSSGAGDGRRPAAASRCDRRVGSTSATRASTVYRPRRAWPPQMQVARRGARAERR